MVTTCVLTSTRCRSACIAAHRVSNDGGVGPARPCFTSSIWALAPASFAARCTNALCGPERRPPPSRLLDLAVTVSPSWDVLSFMPATNELRGAAAAGAARADAQGAELWPFHRGRAVSDAIGVVSGAAGGTADAENAAAGADEGCKAGDERVSIAGRWCAVCAAAGCTLESRIEVVGMLLSSSSDTSSISSSRSGC